MNLESFHYPPSGRHIALQARRTEAAVAQITDFSADTNSVYRKIFSMILTHLPALDGGCLSGAISNIFARARRGETSPFLENCREKKRKPMPKKCRFHKIKRIPVIIWFFQIFFMYGKIGSKRRPQVSRRHRSVWEVAILNELIVTGHFLLRDSS